MKSFVRLLFLAGFVSGSLVSAAQDLNPGFEEVLTNLFTLQRHYLPQEKTYLHLDRNHYIAGDTVWFRGYLVNAATHVPDTSSRYIYVDLVNPADSVVRNLLIRRQDGAYPGYIDLPDDMPQGDYTIWAYTMFMRNAGKDYFFQAPIRISDPLSVRVADDVRFHRDPGSHVLSATVGFRDLSNGGVAHPEELKAGLNKGVLRSWSANKEGYYPLSFRRVDTTRRNVLLIDYDRSRRFVDVPPSAGLFDVTFHPEGGYLIAGEMNTIGFKALNMYGQSEYVTGQVFGPDGEMLVEFTPDYKGMGRFNIFASVVGVGYYAVCTDARGVSRRFALPDVRTDVFGLRVMQRNGSLYVTVSRPESRAADSLALVIQSRGEVLYASRVKESGQPLRFNAQDIPSGVAHVLLIDSRWNVLNERLVFVRNDDQAHANFSTDRPDYPRRTMVRSTVRLTDAQGNPLTGDFSVAVTDDKDIQPDSGRNIYTELLLSSDLKGYVESPAWYFEAGGDAQLRAHALDALMLTQGWRRYDVPALLQKKVAQPHVPLEAGMFVSGRVKALLGRRASAHTSVYMLAPSRRYIDVVETDEQGFFAFAGYEFPDSTSFVVQAVSKRGNDKVELILDEELPKLELPSIPGLARPTENWAYIAKADQKWILENGIRTVHLQAVEVKSQNKNEIESMYSGLADNVYDSKFMEEWGIQQFETLLYMIPGLSYDGQTISIRGGGTPLFVIDEIPQEADFDWKMEINMFDVDRVEVIKGPTAAAFGSRGGNGVILIYTKRGNGTFSRDDLVFNRKVLNPIGYQKPAEFYMPRYTSAAQRARRMPDLRTTIYWNPSVRTNEQGEASFDFTTADGGDRTYSVVIEGVTRSGQVIRTVGKITRAGN